MNIDSVLFTGSFEQTSHFRSGVIDPYEGKHVWDANHVKLPHLYVSMTIERFLKIIISISRAFLKK